jgi:hypothetical protein
MLSAKQVTANRGDWHSFEPPGAMVEAFASAFLQPLEPHLQVATKLAQSCA